MAYSKTPTVYQMEATECGAASLAMIMAYWGRHEPLEKLRVKTGVSRDGCNAKNMVAAARRYHMQTKGLRMELNDLITEAPVPCIIHWNFNHFVVFEGKKGDYYYINDPGQGRRKLTLDDLDGGFTGVVLTFQPEEGFQREHKKSTLLRFVRQRLEGQSLSLLALFVFGLLLVVPGMAIPIFSQVFIDDILIGGNEDWVTALIYIMLFTVALQALLTYYRGMVLQKLQAKLSLLSAHGFLSHLFRLPISFFEQRYAGDLAQRVENNNNVSDFLAGKLAETVLNIFVALFFLVLMLIYSPLLTLVGVAAVLVNMLLMQYCSRRISALAMKLQQDGGRMVGALFSGLNISSTLKASGAEHVFCGRLLGYYAKTAGTEQRLGRMSTALSAIPEVFGDLINILALLFGGLLVIRGEMTAGMLVAFTSLLASFVAPVNELTTFMQSIHALKADMSRVDDIMRYEEDPVFDPAAEDEMAAVNDSAKLSGAVELRDISFGYSRLNPPLVENFDFTLAPGSSIAFVGASGCGKSTVSKLISGLYQPWSGEILMDGHSLSSIPKQVLSSSISTVSQEITLFSGSIRDNLTMWNRSVLDEDLVRAARDACIHEMITRKPDAYNYLLREGGANLSGGQRQRMEIARALASNPTILIMDEATSSLDPIVEKQIMDNIKRRGCTCIIIAHRLSAIRDCDEIIVMDKGRIAQRGNHEELISREGHYQRLLANM